MNQPLKGAAVNSRPPQSNIIQDTAGRAYQRIPISANQGNLSKRENITAREICQKEGPNYSQENLSKKRPKLQPEICQKEVRNYSKKSVKKRPKLQQEICQKEVRNYSQKSVKRGPKLQIGKSVKKRAKITTTEICQNEG
jgi:hypothetical protein